MDLIRKYKWWLFGLIVVGGILTWIERAWVWRENSQDKHILTAARKYGVDPALVKAVVWRESRFNPNARGAKKPTVTSSTASSPRAASPMT